LDKEDFSTYPATATSAERERKGKDIALRLKIT
jgi:hypothetical protein